MLKEVLHLFAGRCQHVNLREVDDAEVVRVDPVEAAAMRDQDLFLLQEVKREKLIIMDIEALHVDLREDVERGLGRTAEMPGMSFSIR